MIDPETGEIMMRWVVLNGVLTECRTDILTDYRDATHVSPADPVDRISCLQWDRNGKPMPTAHFPVKKTDEKPKADDKP